MKKLFPLVVFVLVSSASGQSRMLEFIGDRSKMVYYPLACVEARQVDHKNSVPLFSKDDAESKGFKPAPKCTKESSAKAAATTSPRAAPVRTRGSNLTLNSTETFLEKGHDMPLNLLELQEKFRKFEFKPVVLHVYLTLDDYTVSDPGLKQIFYDHVAFRISDGSATFHVLMFRPRAAELREYLIGRDGEKVVATVSFISHGKDYGGWNLGELKDFQVYKDQ